MNDDDDILDEQDDGAEDQPLPPDVPELAEAQAQMQGLEAVGDAELPPEPQPVPELADAQPPDALPQVPEAIEAPAAEQPPPEPLAAPDIPEPEAIEANDAQPQEQPEVAFGDALAQEQPPADFGAAQNAMAGLEAVGDNELAAELPAADNAPLEMPQPEPQQADVPTDQIEAPAIEQPELAPTAEVQDLFDNSREMMASLEAIEATENPKMPAIRRERIEQADADAAQQEFLDNPPAAKQPDPPAAAEEVPNIDELRAEAERLAAIGRQEAPPAAPKAPKPKQPANAEADDGGPFKADDEEGDRLEADAALLAAVRAKHKAELLHFQGLTEEYLQQTRELNRLRGFLERSRLS